MRPTTMASGQKLGAQHLKTLRHLLPYLWPAGRADILEYFETRAEEPCGRTVFRATLSALLFLEDCGGVPPAAALARDPVLLGAVRDHELQAGEAAPHTARRPATRQQIAPMPPKLPTRAS